MCSPNGLGRNQRSVSLLSDMIKDNIKLTGDRHFQFGSINCEPFRDGGRRALR